ncbi:MAG: hypothetical protein Q3982_02435 [Phoenicibacter congonensis]|uniref:Uncharacterized protein n=1 Tax=Phoenicibacter congonensis TaxID=1944646 RepID=A0AA43RGQ3_9ACTN|nr:hypothetical protein [Phoenicibacter congonensis]
MIDRMNHGYSLRFIFVTPFLSEVERVITHTRDFHQPHDLGNGKLDSLHDLLLNGKNIATTHALFLMATEETIHLIHEGKYILVMDEALEVLCEYNAVAPRDKKVNSGDVKWLIKEGYISIDEKYNVLWKNNTTTDATFHYAEIQRLAENGTLKCIDKVLYWEYPPTVFRAFTTIYVLTYLFQNTMLDAYFSLYGFKYEMLSVEQSNERYVLSEYTTAKQLREEYARLINIYSGKYNAIGEHNYSFSKKWLTKLEQERIEEIKKTVRNYKNHVGAKSSEVMWTTIMDTPLYNKLQHTKGFCYLRRLTSEEKQQPQSQRKLLEQFVPCNARATNDFSDRRTLIYLLNRYLNPEHKKYFSARGFDLSDDQFALSEMLQWIWRSAIRNKEPINLFIPSSRMRSLLCEWLCIPYIP